MSAPTLRPRAGQGLWSSVDIRTPFPEAPYLKVSANAAVLSRAPGRDPRDWTAIRALLPVAYDLDAREDGCDFAWEALGLIALLVPALTGGEVCRCVRGSVAELLAGIEAVRVLAAPPGGRPGLTIVASTCGDDLPRVILGAGCDQERLLDALRAVALHHHPIGHTIDPTQPALVRSAPWARRFAWADPPSGHDRAKAIPTLQRWLSAAGAPVPAVARLLETG